MPTTVLLSYAGPFTQDAVVATGRHLRALPGLSENTRHRLFATFVELAQNIGRYSAHRAGAPGAERGAGVIDIAQTSEGLLVSATNPVSVTASAVLSRLIADLAGLDPDGLKKLHRQRRLGPPPEGSLGAGLGLIELARHASGPLASQSAPRPDGLVDFTLSVPLAAS